MNQAIIIIDPLSSGIELAPTFKKRNIPTIGVTFEPLSRMGFGTEVRTQDFDQIIPYQKNIKHILKKLDPYAIVPGTESAISLVEKLAPDLTPKFANDPLLSYHRQHKALMQEALQKTGVPTLATLETSSENEVEKWILEKNLTHSPLIIKPPLSAGSDKVYHTSAKEDWKRHMKSILTKPSPITKTVSQTVVVQEQAIGPEFAVGTVSAQGKHYLAHLIKYNKTNSGGRRTVYDHVEFINYSHQIHGELFEYTQRALDALGIRWGAAHNEIILTSQGPRLIETGARMCGGPVVGFAREATGSSQADRLVEAYLDHDVTTKGFHFKKTVVPVFLKSPSSGRITNTKALEKVSNLSTFFQKHIWIQEGDSVPQTVDYLTSIGIIALSGDRDAIYKDYKKIRKIESELLIL